MTSDSVETVKTGRPRDGALDSVIMEAAIDLLAEVGYERVSMDAVAARAHTSKAAIYRRWHSKASLVAAAVQCRASASLSFPDRGGLRADLLAAVTVMAAGVSAEDLGLLSGLFAAMRSDPELAETMRCGIASDKAAAIEELFTRARVRGDAVSRKAAELFHEVTFAVIVHQLLVVGEPADGTFLEHLVDAILLPILTSPL